MKVGIITFHRALNYGAVLQAYALQQFLRKLDIDSEIIDYRSSYIETFYKPIKANPLKNPKMYLKEICYLLPNLKKRKKFERFIHTYIKTTRKIDSNEELKKLNKEFDYFITGSDQVWNYKWSGFDKAFFLEFANSEKKYSYAASFGFEKIPVEKEALYKKLLGDFQKISVRENTGKIIVKDLIKKDAVVDLDPSCLIEKEMWGKIAVRPKKAGYVLLYTLEKSDRLNIYAEDIAKKLGTEIVYISDAIKKTSTFKYKGFLSPAEFVGLFANAGYVVTNSFHGLMFSVIFEKEFCLQYQQRLGAPNSRLVDFVKEYQLENRILDSNGSIAQKEIDYARIKNSMQIKIQQAESYFGDIHKKNENVISIDSKDTCCGCRACEQICPKNAIMISKDQEGFLYPVVDHNLCVKCGRCANVCSFKQKKASSNCKKPLKTIIAFNNDEKCRMKSRSGGVFVAVSDLLLENDGIIYGADFNKDFSVQHKRATSKEMRNRFCGSKYVQSDTFNTYSQVFSDLKNGKEVLYSGTACQISGLKSYLMQKGITFPINTLVTIDIVCHGVMSPKIWQDNLKEIKNKFRGEISAVEFRDKSFGWNTHVETYLIDGHKYQSNRYTSIFYDHAGLRPSCYNCPYTSIERYSDITLADAWGIKKVAPEIDSAKGVSLVIINSETGMNLIKRASKALFQKEVALENMMQPNLMRPTELPANRSVFWKKYEEKGYSYIADQCEKNQKRIRNKNIMKATIVKVLRKSHLKK